MTRKILFLVRKIFLLVIILSLVFVSSPTPLLAYVQYRAYNTQGQKHAGGFYTLDGPGGGFLGREFVAGGSVVLDWRDFEPEEGNYQWDILTSSTGLFKSWKQYFDCNICDLGLANPNNCPPIKPLNCSLAMAPGRDFHSVGGVRKTVRLKLRVTEGALPLWLYGGEGKKEGRVTASYGTVCAYKSNEQVWAKDPDCHFDPSSSSTDIARASYYPPYPAHEDAISPIWWNPVFLEKFRKTLLAIGQRIASNPFLSETIEFVEASVGNYGEMILYAPTSTWNPDSLDIILWKEAGYTNKRYADAVLKILEFYMEAFPRFPIALSLGTALYMGGQGFDDGSGVVSVKSEVTTKAFERWGARLYLKHAGLGGGQEPLFRIYCPGQTKCIYESYGPLWALPGNRLTRSGFTNMLQTAVNDRAYIAMLWTSDWRAIVAHDESAPDNEDLLPVLEDYGYKLGPQIRMRDGNNGVVFDSQTIHAGSILKITTKWINDTTWVSLWRPKRIFNFATQTYKEIPYSYPLYFDLMDANGNVVFKTTYMPQKGTETWAIPAGNIDSEDKIFIPWSIPPGQYTPRVGIVLNDEMTKFFNIGWRDSSETSPYSISSKKITVTAPTTPATSLKKGWNKIRWPNVSGLTTEQLLKVCPVIIKSANRKLSIYDYSPSFQTFTPGVTLYVRCSRNVW